MAKQTFTAGQVLTATQVNNLQANDYNWTVNTSTTSYTLQASDAGTRRVMNAAGATTITVNTGIFTAGDTVWIHNINTGTCTVTAGTATVNTAGSLALAQWEGGALYFTSASSAIFFRGAGGNYGVATGGTSSSITVSGVNYTLLTFTSDANLVVSRSGYFDVIIVGGGGGAGAEDVTFQRGCGGGAGGVFEGSIWLNAATYAVDVGAGGAGGGTAAAGTGGSLSQLSTYYARRGGGGNGKTTATSAQGSSNGGAFTEGNGSWDGNVGGAQNNPSGTSAAGGGGYAAAGAASGTGTTGGNGGAGYDISLWLGQTASTTFVAAGGGGSGSVTGGTGGSGIGGNGGTNTTNPTAPTANRGAGGGGACNGRTATAGSAGVVYVRFKS